MFKIKKHFKILLLIALLILGNYRTVIASEFKEEGSILVNGEGIITTKADMCELDFSVITRDDSKIKANEENSAKMNNLLSVLKNMGFTDEDIETTSIYITPIYDYSENIRSFKGYEARNRITLKVKELNDLGKIIDKGLNSGADTIGNLRFGVLNSDELYNEALKVALIDAQKKSNTISKFIEKPIKRIIKIEETSYDNYRQSLEVGSVEQERLSETPIQIQEINIKASIRMELGY